MRKLATVLGVQAPSLYSHYANKDELLDDVANVIMESVDVSGFDSDDWRGALRTWARSYHAALGKHPNIVPYLAYGPSVRPIALDRANAIHGGLVRAGWPQRTATLIGASVKYVVMGAATATFSGGFVDDPAIYAERYPHLTRAHLLRERATEIDAPASNSHWNPCWTAGRQIRTAAENYRATSSKLRVVTVDQARRASRRRPPDDPPERRRIPGPKIPPRGSPCRPRPHPPA